MTAQRLAADAGALGVSLSDHQAQALLDFAELIRRWNRAFNLVSRQDVERLISRHLLDSLSAAPWLLGPRVLDVGTGAGLPGVPLAVARPELTFTLADRNERRIRFVDRVIRTLGLENVATWCGDVRSLPGGRCFDTVVSRAVSGLEDIIGLTGGRLRPGGRWIVLASSREGRDARVPPGAERHRVQIPGLGQAHELLVLENREERPPA